MHDAPEPGEVWQESDGHLLQCYPPGIWLRFGSATPVAPTDNSIAFPLRRVFSKYGVPTMDDPIKEALLEDLSMAQTDRDRWRSKAVWLSNHATTVAAKQSGVNEDKEKEEWKEKGFIPPPTEAM